MSCFLSIVFAHLMIQYVKGGCHDIFLLEEAKTRGLSRPSEYNIVMSGAHHIPWKCLSISTVEGSLTNDGSIVQIWSCYHDVGGISLTTDVPQQQWRYTSNHEIQNERGHCLDVDRSEWENNKPGAKIQIWKCNGWENQKWYFDGDTIKSSNGMCLDVHLDDINKDGGVVQLWDCNGWSNQDWKWNGPTKREIGWLETTSIGSRTLFEGPAKWNECPDGYAITGFYKGDCEGIWCIEEILCATPDPSIGQECKEKDIKLAFDHKGYVECDEGYFIRGIYSSDYENSICDGLSCLERLRCCKWDDVISVSEESTQDWFKCFDEGQQGWCDVPDGQYVTALYRDELNDNYHKKFAPLVRFDRAAAEYGYPMNPDKYLTQFDDKFGDDGTWQDCELIDVGDHWKTICDGPKLYNENTVLDTKSNPTYYRVRDCDDDRNIKIEYWWFYGYQHACFAGQGAHPGDWERVIVDIDPLECEVDSVRYYQHGGWYTAPRDRIKMSGYHPVVYAGKIAHGSYHDTPGGPGACLYFDDFRNPKDDDDNLETWDNLINLETSNDDWIKNKEDICCSNPLNAIKDACNDDPNYCDSSGCDWD